MEDLTGQKFGRLTVIKRDIERDLGEIKAKGTRNEKYPGVVGNWE